MFDIVETSVPTIGPKVHVSIASGTLTLFVKENLSGQRFDYKCTRDTIVIVFNPDGKRQFTGNPSPKYASICSRLKSDFVPYQNAYMVECDVESIDGGYIIKLGEFEDRKKKNTVPSFDFKGFYQSIDDAGLEPFILNGEIAFKKKR